MTEIFHGFNVAFFHNPVFTWCNYKIALGGLDRYRGVDVGSVYIFRFRRRTPGGGVLPYYPLFLSRLLTHLLQIINSNAFRFP